PRGEGRGEEAPFSKALVFRARSTRLGAPVQCPYAKNRCAQPRLGRDNWLPFCQSIAISDMSDPKKSEFEKAAAEQESVGFFTELWLFKRESNRRVSRPRDKAVQ